MNTTLKTKKRRYRSLAEWESLIKDWHTRGLGRGEYCKIHGISYAVFSRWLRRIKGGASAHEVDFSPLASEPADKAPGTFPRKKEAGISSPFIPVYLSSEASPSYEGLKRYATTKMITVIFNILEHFEQVLDNELNALLPLIRSHTRDYSYAIVLLCAAMF